MMMRTARRKKGILLFLATMKKGSIFFIDHKYRNVGDHKTFNYDGKTFNILRNERGDVTGHEPQPSVKKPGTVTLVYFVYTQKRISLM